MGTQMLDSKFYALRWLMLLMAMEFQLPEVLRLWDSFLSDHNRFEFVSYFALAMLEKVRPRLMSGSFASNLQLLQKYPSFDLYELLVPAIEIRKKHNLKKKNKKKIKIKSSKSPRDIFGNILRPQSSRMTNNKPNPSYNIFRSRSPSAKSSSHSFHGNVSSPNGRDRGHSTQTFSFGSWKKKWGK